MRKKSNITHKQIRQTYNMCKGPSTRTNTATRRWLRLSVGVILLCGTLTSGAPNSWPPKMKNFDIWGDIDAAAGVTDQSYDDVPADGNLQAADAAAAAAMSTAEIVQSSVSYGNSTASWQQRDSRVLNFFPLPVDDECLADDGTRSGICLNTYECRIQGGTSKGQCALGFGVCCVFTATCDQEVFNNITYIVSPNFPSLMSRGHKTCKLKIKMISSDVSQLRFDFVHFSLGQPNRSSGLCDGDNFLLSGGSTGNFSLCGQNSGQHLYYDVPGGQADSNNSAAARDDDDDEAIVAGDGIVELLMDFSDRFATSRLFEIRVTQIPFSQRAPAGCLQYFTGAEGIIQTFNFAENGRHLANQDYRACIRQESSMCSIQYEPCFERAFRIGPRRRINLPGLGGDGGGPLTNGGLLDAAAASPLQDAAGNLGPISGVVGDPGAAGAAGAGAPAADDAAAAASADDPNAVEGSGGGDIPAIPGATGALPAVAAPPPSRTGFFSLPGRITSFFTRGLFGFGGGGGNAATTAAAAARRHRSSRQLSAMRAPFYGAECTDRITLPCVVEDFIAAGMGALPACLPIHCGDSLCGAGVLPCRIESTVTPFGIGVHFGEVGADEEKGSPEDNIGACLRYNQLNCG